MENPFNFQAHLEELWESMVHVTQRLLLSASQPAETSAKPTEDDAWNHCVLEHWHRTRTRPAVEDFHRVPHPGKINVETNNNKRRKDEFVVQDLVAI